MSEAGRQMTLIALAAALGLSAGGAAANSPADPHRVADAAFCAGMIHAAGRLQRELDEQLEWLDAQERQGADVDRYNRLVDEYNGGLDALKLVSNTIQRTCGDLRLSREEYAVVCSEPIQGVIFGSSRICQRDTVELRGQ